MPRAPAPHPHAVAAGPEAGRFLPLVEQLAELGRLHQEGLLTEQEFAAAKAQVLRS